MAKQTKAIVAMPEWKQALVAKANVQAATETVGVPRISHRQATLTIDGKKVEGNKISLAVIDYAIEKTYYEQDEYDANSHVTPVCYALRPAGAEGDKGMRPHAAAPKKQAESCDACPHNVFGSAIKGRGKRCKDNRKLFVLAGVTDPEQMKSIEVRQISIPPASLRNWGQYLKSLPDVTETGHISSVYTVIEPVVPPGAMGYQLTFRFGGRLPEALFEAVVKKAPTIQADMVAPYPILTPEKEPEKPTARSKKFR